MPVSADTTQIGIVLETTYGVTPANPVFEVLPITGESLVTAATTELSQTLNPNRQTVDSILTGLDINGSLDFEFAKSPAMTLLLESALGEQSVITGTDSELVVGVDQISFTVEKRWPDPKNPGEYLYHRYVGCVVNTFTLSMTAGAPITGSAALIGKSPVTDETIIAGATYETVSTFTVFRGPDVTNITLDNAEGTLAPAITDSCITDITININNNYRGIQCLGTLGNKEVVIGSFECSYDQTIFFSSNELMDSFIEQDILNEVLTVGDSATDDHYTFTTTRGKFATDEVVAGGTGTDVVNSCSINWLVNNDLSTPTTIAISTSEGLTVPEVTVSEVGSIDATTLVVKTNVEVSIVDETGWSVELNGTTANVIVAASVVNGDLHLLLTDSVINTDTATVSYVALSGNVTNALSSVPMGDVTNANVINNV